MNTESSQEYFRTQSRFKFYLKLKSDISFSNLTRENMSLGSNRIAYVVVTAFTR
jgi:hypothetical protein